MGVPSGHRKKHGREIIGMSSAGEPKEPEHKKLKHVSENWFFSPEISSNFRSYPVLYSLMKFLRQVKEKSLQKEPK